MLPSLQQNEIGTSELDPFRSSILGPRSPLWTLHGCPHEQNLVHHSGSGWLARPSPWGTCTSYSLPAFLAHSAPGHFLPSCRAAGDGRSTPGSGKSDQLGVDRQLIPWRRPWRLGADDGGRGPAKNSCAAI